MSKTVADLGRKAKRTKPWRYGHLSDVEAGRQAKRDYPGAYQQYQDIEEETGLMLHPENSLTAWEGSEALFNSVTDLQHYYNPRRGVFTSFLQRRKSEARAALQSTLNTEQQVVFEGLLQRQQAVLAGEMALAQFNLFIAENKFTLAELKVKGLLIIQAMEKGYTLENWQEEKRLRADHERQKELRELDHKHRLEQLDKELELQTLPYTQDVKTFEAKENIKLNTTLKDRESIVQQSLKNGELANIGQARIIQGEIDNLYDEIEYLKKKNVRGINDRKIADREKMIKWFIEQRDSL